MYKKVEIVTDTLLKAIGTLGTVVTANSSLQVLSNIAISLEGGLLVLMATDLEGAGKIVIPVTTTDTGDEWKTTVLYKQLQKLAASRKGSDHIRMQYDGTKLKLSDTKWTASIATIDYSEFPLFPQEGHTFHTCAASLLNELSVVGVCSAKNSASAALQGISVAGARATATDGYRMASIDLPLGIDFLIRNTTASTLSSFLRYGGDEEVIVSVGAIGHTVYFKGETWALAAQLISATYPDVSPYMTIPDVYVTCPTEELLQSLKSVIDIDVTLSVSDSVLTVFSENMEGKTTETIPVTGKDFDDIRVNVQYLSDAVKQIKEDRVSISVTARTNPVHIFSTTKHFVVMPLSRIN